MITIKDEKLTNIKNLNVFLEDEVSNQEVEETSCFAYWGNTPKVSDIRPTLRLIESPYFGYGTEKTPFGILYAYEEELYYNTLIGNGIQKMLESDWQPTDEEFEQATQAIELISKYCITKYNQHPLFSLDNMDIVPGKKILLLIDQPIDSDNVLLCDANEENFSNMFLHAFENYTDHIICVKYHPSSINGFKEGYLQRFLKQNKLTDHPAVRVIDYNCNTASIFYYVDEVFTVTSSIGYEAALRGINLTTFGKSFYSGYGFTQDMVTESKKQRSVIDIFIANFIKQGIYINPFNQEKGTILDVLSYISLQLRHRNLKDIIFYKSEISKSNGIPFLLNLNNPKTISSSNKANFVFEKDTLIVADNSISFGQIPKAHKKAFVSDGFLFSSNQNNKNCPISIIFDTRAAYYQENNELEEMLDSEKFTKYELNQSEAFIGQIKAKFTRDLESHPSNNLNRYFSENKKIILIPGTSDDNLYNYEPMIRSDYDLICAVNERMHDAVIIYKPKNKIKSDLLKKIRKQLSIKNNNQVFIDTENDISQCLNISQEVHTVNNIFAIEALIHGKHVVTYGKSFYSQRGLTTDLFNDGQIKEPLTLQELVAGAFMFYPRYKINNIDYFVSVNSAVDVYMKNYVDNIKPVNQSLFKKIVYAILND